MELRHLQYFRTLATELHFGNAAKKLFISQPPLSRQIKELEKELSVELFLRNNKKVELTKAGRYFYEKVDQLIEQLESIKNSTRLIHNQVSGEFRLGFMSSLPKPMLAKILDALKSAFPLLQVNLIEAASHRQIEALKNGRLDLAIFRGGMIDNDIVKEPLFEDQLCIVTMEGKPIKNMEDMKEADFISFNRDYAPEYYQQGIDFCHKLGFQPKVKHHCNNMNAILDLVELGIGYAIAPLATLRDRRLEIVTSSALNMKANSRVYLGYHQDNSVAGLESIAELILRAEK